MTPRAPADDRLDTLVLARLDTSARPPKPRELAQALRRFAPRELAEAQWREQLGGVLESLRARELVSAEGRPRAGEVARRLGGPAPKRWQALVNRVLPALALGVAPSDAKAHGRLKGRDAWAAAIAARSLDLWRAGPPPSLGALCDALVWRAVGVPGTPQRCPSELRAHVLRPHVEGAAGAADRIVRVLAAKLVAAPRAELRALLDGLVRLWLEGRELGPGAVEPAPVEPAPVEPAPEPPEPPEPDAAAPSAEARSLVEEVRAAAAAERVGVFGDRKVFVSAIWEALRRQPAWAALELDDLKAQLVAAHRAGELVLARADLVAAMPHALVSASEIRTDGATFHFVVREPVA